MRNFISPNSHPSSFLTGSTVESFIDKTKELNTGYYTCTDNGYLTNTFKVYNLAKKKGLKPILGCELYIVNDCPLTKNFKSEKIKYFTLTVHAKTQEAYQLLVKKLSEKDRNTIDILDQEYPLFDWKDIYELSQNDFTAVIGGPQCVVCKPLLLDEAHISLGVLSRLKDLFEEDLYASILPIKFDKRLVTSSIFTLTNGETVTLDASLMAETAFARNYRVSLEEVANKPAKHKSIKRIYVNGVGYNVNKDIVSALNTKSSKDIGVDIFNMYNTFILENMELHKLLLNDYSYLADESDKLVQDLKIGEEKKLDLKYNIKTSEEAFETLSLTVEAHDIEGMIDNSYEWASKFDNFELKYDYQLVKEHDNHLKATMDLIKEIGRFDPTNEVQRKRLKHEIDVIHGNGEIDLLPYFFPISRVLNYYAENNRIVGPARGSAGGSFLMYCMGITQVDPIKYGLYFSRFLTLGRILKGTLPDVDVDLPDRDLLMGENGFFEENYKNRWAQLSTRTIMKLKSSVRDVNRYMKGKVEEDVEKFAKGLEATPQGVSDADFVFGYEDQDGNHIDGLLDKDPKLQLYALERPKEWEIVQRTLGISRQNGRHACFAAGTLVDSNGKVEFIDLAPDFADNKPITTWYSGVKDTIVVSMNNGVSIKCTPDHRFMVGNKEIEAKDLVGEEISYKPFTNTSGKMTYNSDYCFAWGWFLNDGAYIKSPNGDERFDFYFTPGKDDEAKDKILSFFKKTNIKITADKKRKDRYKAYNLDFNFKIKQKTYKKRLPENFWELDLRSQRGFMFGLFSANGYCLSTRPTIGIKLSSKLLISDIAIWLNSKDINTSCSYSKPVETKHYNGIYTSKSTATLVIPHFTNKIAFENLVGFIQDYKSDRLRQIIEDANNTKYTPNTIKCLYVENSGKAPVWDFNEPLESVGYINGILVHNCGFVLSPTPLSDTIPLMKVAGHENITQYQPNEVEAAGLNKYDFLIVKCLNDIELALKYINKKNYYDQDWAQEGYKIENSHLRHNGDELYIWDLPEEKEVFDMLTEGKTETVFQLHTTSVTPYVKKMMPKSIEDCAVVTSLVRPGPLEFIDERTGRNMAQEYIERGNGRSKGEIPILDELLPETYGVMVFQEQITKMTKELTGWDDEKAEDVRIAVGKKKLKMIEELRPQFIKASASTGRVDEETAAIIWAMIEKFGRYGFNKCVSGDTVLLRNKCGSKPLTVAEMYKACNDKKWAKENNKESVGKKYRTKGYGKGVSKKADRLFPNNIVDIRFEGVKEVWEITTESGKKIKTTDNHKFPTPKGEIVLGELKVGDVLYTNGGYEVKDSTHRFDSGNNYPKKGEMGFQKNPNSSLNIYKNRSKLLKENDRCNICAEDFDGKRKEIHHKDGNHSNQDWDNLVLCCVSCHKKEHYKMGRVKQGEKGLLCDTERIVSINFVGKEEVYDVEMEAPYHNFVTESGIVTCNSHAVAYSMIAYACAYLKYHYPLEWWTSVLSNATEKKITEIHWPHVRDILSAPDINLSEEEMVIDYKNGLIRNKLSILRGLGEKVANKITEGRPYKDIKDFTNKKVVGAALTRKLIHIGVLDSLFEANLPIMDKMQLFENAVEELAYRTKIFKKLGTEVDTDLDIETLISFAQDHEKLKRMKHVVKEGKIDEKYIFMNPIKDYILKKSIFPTMPMNLHDIIKDSATSVNITDTGESLYCTDKYGKDNRYINGNMFQKIKNLPVQPDSGKVVKFATTGYVIDSEEFSYQQGTKKALKLQVDIDGYLEELVLWPDYDSGVLSYPDNLKKGSVIFLFMYRKMNKEKYHTNIDNIVVEDIPIG